MAEYQGCGYYVDACCSAQMMLRTAAEVGLTRVFDGCGSGALCVCVVLTLIFH